MSEFVKRSLTALLVLGAMGLMSGCQPAGDAPISEAEVAETAVERPSLEVLASTPSLCYLVAELAVDLAECEVLSEDPESYRPTPERIVEIGGADLIVVNGLGLEKWLEGASLPVSRLVEASANVDAIELEAVTHSHGPEGQHSHRESDPRVWMDPLALANQADELAAALGRALPEHAETIEQRRFDLATSLGALVAESRQRLLAAAGLDGDSQQRIELATLSPRFSYFARALGVDLEAFVPEGGEAAELSGHDLGHLKSWLAKARFAVVIEHARGADAGSPAARQVAGLDSVDVVMVELDGLGGLAGGSLDGRDYVERFRENVSRLEAALSATVN